MVQNKEAEAFIERIKALPPGPGVPLDDVLKPSIEDETELRRYFANNRDHARLTDPFVGLVDVFDAPVDIRTTRARVVKTDDDGGDMMAKYVMPVPERSRRAEGTPCMVEDLDEFKKNWFIFTEGSLSQLSDWSNVVAAGGSVLACLTPLTEENKASKRTIRKHYHSTAYPTSDVDLFLWGLTPEQAEDKIVKIYEAVRDSVPWDVTCVRTKHTVSIHSQYPCRSVQIVLRLYQSPAEILAGFDIDSPCCAYDGTRIWANPRAIVAMMRQANTVDMTRRSPSYEVRLAKYAKRGYEVYIPDLQRSDIDPTIYERAINKMEGLARLLILEKLTSDDTHLSFLDARRKLRRRPNPRSAYRQKSKKRYKGDLKFETVPGGLEMNDYDVCSLHIPYGPGWNARRIDGLVYKTDLAMNSTFNPKNKGRRLHRHPAFFGTAQECMEDCCGKCPLPVDDDERKLRLSEEGRYITGRIKFVEENPGRQTMSGSFNPIDSGEWSEQVYIKETERFFTAISRNDVKVVRAHIKAGIDLNARDYVGRTCLHVAIFSAATNAAIELIKAGVRISARLADGRSALHLAARYDQIEVVAKLMERSAANESLVSEGRPGKDEQGRDEATGLPDATRPSSEDDLPGQYEDRPDILDINEADWDFGFSPLSHAIAFASPAMIDFLLTLGAAVNKPTSANHNKVAQRHPLALTILRSDEGLACTIAERLIAAGASSSTAESGNAFTIFHDIVGAGKLKLAATLLKRDPNAGKVLDAPGITHNSEVVSPLVTAVQHLDYGMVALLLAHGAKTDISEEDVSRSVHSLPSWQRNSSLNYQDKVISPLEVALSQKDDLFFLLMAFGADPDVPILNSKQPYASARERRSLKDWVGCALLEIDTRLEAMGKGEQGGSVPPSELTIDNGAIFNGWQDCLQALKRASDDALARDSCIADSQTWNTANTTLDLQSVKAYLFDVQKSLEEKGAKSWEELYPDIAVDLNPKPTNRYASYLATQVQDRDATYCYVTAAANNVFPYRGTNVPTHLTPLYDELFEACYRGDNEKVKELCIPPKGSNEGDVRLLSIGVQAKNNGDNLGASNSGWTPLYAAYAGRRWSTMRLIVAIAAMQHSPAEDDGVKAMFKIGSLGDESDASDSDDFMEESNDISDQKKGVEFMDIAKVPSAVRSDVSPARLIDMVETRYRVPADPIKYPRTGNIITEAILRNDFEAFKNVANLYLSLTPPIEFGPKVLDAIIEADDAVILDWYIRHTGHGLNYEVVGKVASKRPQAVNDENQFYLGLNIGGKKREDLARRNPSAIWRSPFTAYPLWLAAVGGRTSVIAYLGSDKPLAAFRHHAERCSDSRAEDLRRIENLEEVLPGWLGWCVSTLGESPLVAAILGGSVPGLKALFKANPAFMKAMLFQKIQVVDYNPLLLAVAVDAQTDILDFLLAKSVSPVAHDASKGWNVLHHVCANANIVNFKHLLTKLPKDTFQDLLKWQSKGRLNTPLHVAVRRGALELVQAILAFDDSTALSCNVDGQTPLHYAIAEGFSQITEMLLRTPQCGGLHKEDCIGQTPFDLAAVKEQQVLLQKNFRPTIAPLPANSPPDQPLRMNVERYSAQLARIKEAVRDMLGKSIPERPEEFEAKMNGFAEAVERSLEEFKRMKQGLMEEPPNPWNPNALDVCDVEKTWEVVRGCLADGVGHHQRELVKLLDVQVSVQATLDRIEEGAVGPPFDTLNGRWRRVRPRRAGRAQVEAKEDPEEREWKKAMICHRVSRDPDTV